MKYNHNDLYFPEFKRKKTVNQIKNQKTKKLDMTNLILFGLLIVVIALFFIR